MANHRGGRRPRIIYEPRRCELRIPLAARHQELLAFVQTHGEPERIDADALAELVRLKIELEAACLTDRLTPRLPPGPAEGGGKEGGS